MRILVADSDKVWRAQARDILAGEGWVVDLASRCSEVLEAVRSHQYEALLVDTRLAGLAKADLIGEAKRHQPSSLKLVVTVSENSSRGQLDAMVAAARRVDQALYKPYTKNELLAAVAPSSP